MTHSFTKLGAHGGGTSTALTFTRSSDGPGGGAFNPANKSLLVAIVSVKLVNHTAITGPDASWVKIDGGYESNSPNDVSVSLWWKQATISEPATYVWSFTGGGTSNIELYEFGSDIEGAWASDKFDHNNGSNSNVGSITFPTGTGTLGHAIEVSVAAAAHDSSNGGETGEAITSPFTVGSPPVQTSRITSGYTITSATTALNPTLSWPTNRRTAAVIGTWYKVPPVGQTTDLRWDLAAEVRATNDLRWDVAGTPVGAATDLRWDLNQIVGQPTDLRWDSGGPVRSDLALVWDVSDRIPVRTDLTAQWLVRAPIAAITTRISSADLLDLRFVGLRTSRFRWDILGSDNKVKGTIKPTMTQAPVITNDVTRAIKRDLSGFVLTPTEQANINPESDRIRPVMILQNGEEFPMGVYLFVQGSRAPSSYGKTFSGHLMDQCWVVDQPSPTSVGFAPGTSVHRALTEILHGIAGLGEIRIDTFVTDIGPSGILWPGGTSLLRMVNDLCALAGCYDLYFDNQGIGHIRLVQGDLTAITPAVVYTEGIPGKGPTGNIINDSTIETDNLLNSANRFVVVDSQAQNSPIVGIYDIPDSSPNSFIKRGIRVVSYITQQGLQSISAANTAAQAAAAKSAADFSWWSFQGIIDPRHDTYDVLQVRGKIVREQKWSTPVVEGANMTHDVRLAYV